MREAAMMIGTRHRTVLMGSSGSAPNSIIPMGVSTYTVEPTMLLLLLMLLLMLLLAAAMLWPQR